MAVNRDDVKGELHITDMGVTVRTLLGFAAKGYDLTNIRTWKIVYNGTLIGSLQVRNKDKGKKDANSNGTGIRKRKAARTTPTAATTGTKATEGTTVVVAERPPEPVSFGHSESDGKERVDNTPGAESPGDGGHSQGVQPEIGQGPRNLLRRTKDARGVRIVAGNQSEALRTEGKGGCGGDCNSCTRPSPGTDAPQRHADGRQNPPGDTPEIVGTI
jgi:hypothetical protein